MLTDAQRQERANAIRAHLRRFPLVANGKLLNIEVRHDGTIQFQSLEPIKEPLLRIFPNFRIERDGIEYIPGDWPNTMRYSHWVEMRAECE